MLKSESKAASNVQSFECSLDPFLHTLTVYYRRPSLAKLVDLPTSARVSIVNKPAKVLYVAQR